MFFSSDPANPDTYPHFYADLQMYDTTMAAARPRAVHAPVLLLGGVASKENKWQGPTSPASATTSTTALYRAAETEIDPVKRAALFIKMNDLVVQSGMVIPIALTAKASAMSNRLRGVDHNPYEVDFWSLPYWHREA